MATGWSSSKSTVDIARSVGLCVLVLCSTGCESALEPRPLLACAEIEVRDNVVLDLAGTEPLSLQADSGVTTSSDGALVEFSGQGRASVACPDLQRIQVLGASAVQAHGKLDNLTSIRAYGHSQIEVIGISDPDLSVRSSGEAQLVLMDLDVDEIELQVAGRSEVALSGRADQLRVQTLGDASVAADELRAQSVTVDGSGRGPVVVWATAHLHVGAQLAGDIEWVGQPDLTDDRVESP